MARGPMSTGSRRHVLRLAQWWFGPHAIERAGAVYRPVGVRRVKALLMATLGRVFRGSNYSLEGRDGDALRQFEYWTMVNETYHLAFFFLFAIAAGWVLVRQHRLPLELMVLGCVVNLYLVLVQRYNRARIRGTLRRMQARARPSSRLQPNER